MKVAEPTYSELRDMNKRAKDLKLTTLYADYENNLLTIQRCINFLKEMEKTVTHEYEQKYLQILNL